MNRSPQPQFCFKCVAIFLVIILFFGLSFWWIEFNLRTLFTESAVSSAVTFIQRFFTPDLSYKFILKIYDGAIQTIAISLLGTLLAAIIAFFLALGVKPASPLFIRGVIRFLLNFLRSVPELVWASLMVLAVGLGPFAGVLAIALHTTGVLGRLFAETLENASPEVTNALLRNGTSSFLAYLFGTLPQVSSQFISYILYRWEMNIRMATILGFVGAGGLGQILYYELSLLHESRASTVIIAMLILVVAVDLLSSRLRKSNMPANC